MKPISLQQSSNTNCHPRSTNSRSVRSQLKGWSRLMKTGWTCFSPCSYKGWWWSFWHFWPHHLSRPNLGYQYLRISRRRPQVCVCVCASHVPTKSTILLISANNFDSCSSCQTLNILQPHPLPTCQKVWGHPTSWWHWLLDLIGHCEASQQDILSVILLGFSRLGSCLHSRRILV